MVEKLIALRDISDGVKAGDRFEAPDRIYVALGWATDDTSDEPSSRPSVSPAQPPSRRRSRRSVQP